ncbi:formate dehydrogenase subunit gamma [Dyella sp.]|uniref:formate dehydrogenase subunit gamma n=1 Tax=Dyella sp. TaxID=1869338 RepID=UPI002D792B13|nr:formate dehydrogenase subunit gamma [Dyella sp.]HET6431827.1 formate dehydrogenase subunit gamma [Dyella sp.]
MSALDPEISERVAAIVATWKDTPGALLPILHAVQDTVGYVPPASVPEIADRLNLSRAEVHGVISFYHFFRDAPPGRRTVQICRAEACQSMDARALESHVRQRLGIGVHETTGDGEFSLEAVYCLGQCSCAPAMMIDGNVHVRMTPERFDHLISAPRIRPGRTTVGAAAGAATRVFVPCDSGALALGAEEVATAIAGTAAARDIPITIVRNGSRGMYWAEPLVEIETESGRLAYGPVSVADVAGLFDAGFLTGGAHALALGPTEDIPFLKNQERLTFARVGIIDPIGIDDYLAHGGYGGLRRAVTMSGAEIVQAVTDSGLRGRGGAALPTGIKWKTVLDQPASQKYVTCNADEGDSGTFADRMVMEGDPFVVIEGMTIAGIAVGATEGFIYLRVEYPHARRTLETAIATAYDRGYLGADVLGSGKRFDLHLRIGAGAYICGEETSMLESLEGKRGEVRYRPPLPAVEGLFGKPTIVNNVISLASVPIILDRGPAFYRDFGVGRSRGTLPIQLAGNVRRGGLIEKAFGVTLRELVDGYGGGSRSGRPVRAVQAGGPLGAYMPLSQFDTPLDYEAFVSVGAMLGHGGFVVFDDTVDMAQMARYAMEFCAIESCGKCTPCRIGSTRGVEVIDRMMAGTEREADEALLRDLCQTMLHGSLCALGGMAPFPVLSALDHYPEDFARTA